MHITRSHNLKRTVAITAAALDMFSLDQRGVAAAGLFAPIQAAPLEAVEPAEQGHASGVAMVIHGLGGVIGAAVLGTVFVAHGSTGIGPGRSWPVSAPPC